jgi:hypothetical protein
VLQVRLEQEASNYFFANGDRVLDLRMAVEGMRFINGLPVDGLQYVDANGIHVWEILDHVIVYRIDGNLLTVIVVMPAK